MTIQGSVVPNSKIAAIECPEQWSSLTSGDHIPLLRLIGGKVVISWKSPDARGFRVAADDIQRFFRPLFFFLNQTNEGCFLWPSREESINGVTSRPRSRSLQFSPAWEALIPAAKRGRSPLPHGKNGMILAPRQ